MANKIKCPKCGEEIDIENLIQAEAKDALDKKLAQQKAELDKQLEQYKKDTEEIKKQLEKDKERAIEEAIKSQKQEFKAKENEIKK